MVLESMLYARKEQRDLECVSQTGLRENKITKSKPDGVDERQWLELVLTLDGRKTQPQDCRTPNRDIAWRS